jgi:hypothetical protein
VDDIGYGAARLFIRLATPSAPYLDFLAGLSFGSALGLCVPGIIGGVNLGFMPQLP